MGQPTKAQQLLLQETQPAPQGTLAVTTSCIAFAPRVRLFAEVHASNRWSRTDLQPVSGCLPSQDVCQPEVMQQLRYRKHLQCPQNQPWAAT